MALSSGIHLCIDDLVGCGLSSIKWRFWESWWLSGIHRRSGRTVCDQLLLFEPAEHHLDAVPQAVQHDFLRGGSLPRRVDWMRGGHSLSWQPWRYPPACCAFLTRNVPIGGSLQGWGFWFRFSRIVAFGFACWDFRLTQTRTHLCCRKQASASDLRPSSLPV